MDGNKTLLQLNRVSKRYNIYSSNIERIKSVILGKDPVEIKYALSDISFEVKQGERIILFGIADSGRSTLLKILSQVSTPSKGRMIVNCSQNVMLDSKVGIEKEFTCRENIFLKANVVGIKKTEIKPQVDSILRECECEKYANLPLKSAPKGTNTMLSLAVHLRKSADLLIADEVFGGGGAHIVNKCEKALLEYFSKHQKCSAIISSNRIPFAKDIGTRGIVLDKGKVVFDGDIMEAVRAFKTLTSSNN